MTLSRRAQMVLGGGSAILLGGILGLALWSWWLRHHRPRRELVVRFPRGRAAVIALGLVVIAVGACWRLIMAIQSVPSCASSAGAPVVTRSSSFDLSLVAQKVATWPETGIGELYARARGAPVCWSRSANYYVAIHANTLIGARAINLGDVILSPRYSMSRDEMAALARHEAGHRPQWAMGTIIGGPFAFPAAYAIDEFFFPRSRNHFERLAGLKSGGYSDSGTGPVLGPAQLATLAALSAFVVVVLFAARYRRASSRSRRPGDLPESGPSPSRIQVPDQSGAGSTNRDLPMP